MATHKQCDWCGVIMSLDEGNSSQTTITNPCTNESTNYSLCFYCREFPSKESVEYYKGFLVNWALLNVPISLDSKTSECKNGEWTVTLNITVKYGSELIPVRIGWIC